MDAIADVLFATATQILLHIQQTQAIAVALMKQQLPADAPTILLIRLLHPAVATTVVTTDATTIILLIQQIHPAAVTTDAIHVIIQ